MQMNEPQENKIWLEKTEKKFQEANNIDSPEGTISSRQEKVDYSNYLNDHLNDIDTFLGKIKIQKLEESDINDIIGDLLLIRSNIKKLKDLISGSDARITENSHFEHVIGNFSGGLQTINRIIEGKAEQELIKDYQDETSKVSQYISECISDVSFLKSELENEKGASIQ